MRSVISNRPSAVVQLGGLALQSGTPKFDFAKHRALDNWLRRPVLRDARKHKAVGEIRGLDLDANYLLIRRPDKSESVRSRRGSAHPH
ncbi:MAG: hypothetical protein D6781_04185 [Verrucomicrobia bacterium]|nr:MAG: hypothetical protein D6781_04185 [Verrucomicrobiota bacterium]